MKIKKIEQADIAAVVEIWYNASLVAHDFIPAEYWASQRPKLAKKYIPNSETYIAHVDNEIVGFVSMMDNYLAAIFVKKSRQKEGIGTQLLEYVQKQRQTIKLQVYKKNRDSVQFYKNRGFKIISKNIEENFGEPEYIMEWNKKKK